MPGGLVGFGTFAISIPGQQVVWELLTIILHSRRISYQPSRRIQYITHMFWNINTGMNRMNSMLSKMWKKWMRNSVWLRRIQNPHRGIVALSVFCKKIPALFSALKQINIDLIIIVVIKERSGLTCFDFNFRPLSVTSIMLPFSLHMYVCFRTWTVYDVCHAYKITFVWISVGIYVDICASLCLFPCMRVSVRAGI